jgi:hypothetical protein
MNSRRVAVITVVVFVVLGISFFGLLAARSISVERTDRTGAQNNFEDALAGIPSPTPLVRRDPSGRFMRRAPTPPAAEKPTHLYVLAYYADGNRLVRADVPLWFYRVKGPAAAYALRGTGFDLDALGLTADDLQQAGAGVVLDETRATGDRLLAWTR